MRLAPSRTTKISLGLAVVAFLIAAIGFFFLVKPLRAEASEAEAETAELQQQLVGLEAQLTALREQPQDSVPDFFRLSKAAPVNVDLPGANLELLTLADRAGVELRAFQSADVVELPEFTAPTFTVTLRGRMDEVTDYFKRLRNLVVVRSNKVTARGNLYRIDQFDLQATELPEDVLEATVTLSITAPPSVSPEESGTATSPEGEGDAPEGDAPEGDAPPEESPDEGADG